MHARQDLMLGKYQNILDLGKYSLLHRTTNECAIIFSDCIWW